MLENDNDMSTGVRSCSRNVSQQDQQQICRICMASEAEADGELTPIFEKNAMEIFLICGVKIKVIKACYGRSMNID